MKTNRPSVVTNDMLYYLDHLRESGVTNMFGAAAYVQKEFNLTEDEANQVTLYWMRTFGERQGDHP